MLVTNFTKHFRWCISAFFWQYHLSKSDVKMNGYSLRGISILTRWHWHWHYFYTTIDKPTGSHALTLFWHMRLFSVYANTNTQLSSSSPLVVLVATSILPPPPKKITFMWIPLLTNMTLEPQTKGYFLIIVGLTFSLVHSHPISLIVTSGTAHYTLKPVCMSRVHNTLPT